MRFIYEMYPKIIKYVNFKNNNDESNDYDTDKNNKKKKTQYNYCLIL